MQHWTDNHIVYDIARDVYVGYDESGLEHVSSLDRDEVVNELIEYAEEINE